MRRSGTKQLTQEQDYEPHSEILGHEPEEHAIAITCSILLVVPPATSPISVRGSRDQTCRKASIERPARRTHPRSGSKSFSVIRC